MSKCKYIKQKINKGVWCIYNDKRVSRELCSKCNLEDRYNKEDYTIKKNSINKPIKGKKHKLTKATEIPKEVKLRVWERDNRRCIFCKKEVPWNLANSHYIKRSQLGLGIEENVMTNCERCHKLYEESSQREQMKEIAKNYFMSLYHGWDEKNLIYKKTR